jgi:hypothetical protein
VIQQEVQDHAYPGLDEIEAADIGTVYVAPICPLSLEHALAIQVSQYSQDRGISYLPLSGKDLVYFSHRGLSLLPDHLHHLRFQGA